MMTPAVYHCVTLPGRHTTLSQQSGVAHEWDRLNNEAHHDKISYEFLPSAKRRGRSWKPPPVRSPITALTLEATSPSHIASHVSRVCTHAMPPTRHPPQAACGTRTAHYHQAQASGLLGRICERSSASGIQLIPGGFLPPHVPMAHCDGLK
jgi:hypothetical protein